MVDGVNGMLMAKRLRYYNWVVIPKKIINFHYINLRFHQSDTPFLGGEHFLTSKH